MEGVGHGLRPLHGDVGRQEAVCAAHPRERLALHLGVEVHDLHEPVHARIGAAGADGGDGLVGEAREGGFEVVLDGAARRLALPAVVSLSEVADAECPPHGRAFESRGIS